MRGRGRVSGIALGGSLAIWWRAGRGGGALSPKTRKGERFVLGGAARGNG